MHSLFTVYNEQYGDERRAIPAGTPFDQLPMEYACSTCDAPKQDMKAVQLTAMALNGRQ